jgi:hypothetical protein
MKREKLVLKKRFSGRRRILVEIRLEKGGFLHDATRI